MEGLQDFKNKVLENGVHYITSDYKTRNKSRPDHKGIDLVSHNGKQTTTDEIVAIEDGIVTISTYSSSAGYYVQIKHNNEYTTRYLHMKKGSIKAKVGDRVVKGQILGYMGNTGKSDGAHLHFDINDGENYVDPLPYLEGTKTFEKKSDKIEEDGLWGKGTTKKAQQVFGTTADGIVSNQYQTYKTKNPGLLDSTFEWKNKPAKGGSPLIKKIQKLVGATQDGFIGTDTIKKMQKHFKTPIDGKVSKPSIMVKEFQKWLNKQ